MAFLRLIANDRAIGEVVNIGSNEEVSIEQLAHFVKQRTNSKSPITYVPYDQAYEAGLRRYAAPRAVSGETRTADGLSSGNSTFKNYRSR